MKYDLRKLSQMVCVARCGSFSGAAEQLHLTQPALSRNIAALERELGIVFFNRGRGGATLTAEGAVAVEAAEALLRQADVLEHNLRLLHRGDTGRIAFGMGPMVASLALSRLSCAFLRERPQLHLRAAVKPAPELLEDLLQDRIELVVCGREQLQLSPLVRVAPLARLPIAHVVRAGHPLAGKRSVKASLLQAYPYLAGAELPATLAAAGGLACDNYHILREVTLESDGIWLTYPHLIQSDLASGTLCQLRPAGEARPTHTEVCGLSRAGFELSPAAEHILDFLRDFFTAPGIQGSAKRSEQARA